MESQFDFVTLNSDLFNHKDPVKRLWKERVRCIRMSENMATDHRQRKSGSDSRRLAKVNPDFLLQQDHSSYILETLAKLWKKIVWYGKCEFI